MFLMQFSGHEELMFSLAAVQSGIVEVEMTDRVRITKAENCRGILRDSQFSDLGSGFA